MGLNVDIAHMKIAEVCPSFLEKHKDWLVHAHICDYPGMHTRDQSFGAWDPVERFRSQFYPYLRVLTEAGRDLTGSRKARLYSNAVALELEGCNRIGWIHQSISAMRHATDAVHQYPHRITQSCAPVAP